MQEEARILVHALVNGAETALQGYNDNTDIVTGGLVDQLRLIERMDRQRPLTSRTLTDIAGKSNLYRVTVFDRRGRRVAWNNLPDHQPIFQDCDPSVRLEPIFSGRADQINLGIRQSPSNKGPRLVIAVARRRGGAIVGNVDASKLVELRRQIGPGRLIQRIGANEPGIEYIIWQNRDAIIAATPNVVDAESIPSDPVLSSAIDQNRPSTRFTRFNGKRVFEAVSPFVSNGVNMGIFRIGMNADPIDIANKRLQTRLLMLLGLAVIGGISVFSLMASRRNESLMAEAYLREQRFSSAILSNMADAVISVDDNRCVTMLNTAAEQLLHVDACEVRGKPLAEAMPGFGTGLQELLSGEGPSVEREFACTIAGKKRILSGNFNPLEAGAESQGGAVVVLRDMTGQREMQQLIERQEKLTAMGELASGVAHEIRNPLNAIGVLGQRLAMEFTPVEGVDEYRQLAGAIVGEVHRVDAIIRRFLKFARPPRLRLAETDMADWLVSYRPLLEGEAETRRANLILPAGNPCRVSIDREQMQQALLNLVRNAVESVDPGGKVTVTCGRSDSCAFIEVADTGKGIPAALMQQIFNLYFTTKANGTGMGLSIANQIVQAHGGMIRVESAEGQGSTFTIELPLS